MSRVQVNKQVQLMSGAKLMQAPNMYVLSKTIQGTIMKGPVVLHDLSADMLSILEWVAHTFEM